MKQENTVFSGIDFNSIADINDFKQRMKALINSLPENIENKSMFENLMMQELDNFTVEAEAKKRKIDLTILFEYEKHYLDLIKDYKEEIKFANAIQEDLRKERAKFFSENLKEVSKTLTETKVDNEVASKWIQELVDSYTKSLDLSNDLVKVNIMDTIGKLRQETSSTIKKDKSDKHSK